MPSLIRSAHTPAQRVFVAGANGYIGRFVVQALIARGHHVTAFVRPQAADASFRDPLLQSGVVRAGDVTDATSLARDGIAGETFDAFVSCLASRSGAPDDAWRIDHAANRTLLDAAVASSARHFVLLSAICVQRPVLAFQHAKLAFEAELRQSDLDWSIVRPTAFFKSLAGQVKRVKAGKAFMMFGARGDGPACLPISERDTAEFIADCLEDPALSGRILPIGGPGTAVTPRERGEMLFALAGLRPRYRHIPLALFNGSIPVLGTGARVLPRLARAAEFARIGRFYATEPMLVRDPDGVYRAESTPQYGSDTLDAFYRRVWRDGVDGQELGEQGLF